MRQYRVLPVVGDQKSAPLAALLKAEGFEVVEAVQPDTAWREAALDQVDAVLLACGPPLEGATASLLALRRESDVSVVAIGSLTPLQIVRLLESGADDCVQLTASPAELGARLRAVIRRREPRRNRAAKEPHALRFDGLTLDLDRRELRRNEGEVVSLTESQFALLVLFATHRGDVLDRKTIYRNLLRREWSPDDRSIDIAVGRVRQKIEPDPRNPALLKTVRGRGYVFVAPVVRVCA